MQSFPHNLKPNVTILYKALKRIASIREDDITDRNTFDSIFVRGRKTSKVPVTSVSAYSDKAGDINYDENYLYICQNIGGTLVWTTIPITSFTILYYGSMYALAAAQSVTISASTTYYSVTGGMSSGSSNAFSFQSSSELLCNIAGTYEATWDMTVECATAAQNIGGGLMLDGTEITASLTTVDATASGTEYTMCGSAIFDIAVDEVVTFCVANNTATNSIIVDNAHLTLKRIK